jgi:hypothetical protein
MSMPANVLHLELAIKDLPGHLAGLEVNKIFNGICHSARGKIREYVAQHLFR